MYLLIINNTDPLHFIGETREIVFNCLARWCKKVWDPYDMDMKCPKDPKKRVKIYFEMTTWESYTLKKVPVEDK